MTGTDRAIRYSTIGAVSVVAIIAAVISYQHATAVIRAHGESGVIARIYAGTIDGLIYAASMALLDAARRQLPAPVLARWLLGAGIAATLAANIAAGLAYGPVGALVAAWPAGALVGSYELLMVIIRQGASRAPVPGVPEAGNGAPAHLIEAQQKFADQIGRKEIPTIREIRTGLGVGAAKAAEAQRHLQVLTRA